MKTMKCCQTKMTHFIFSSNIYTCTMGNKFSLKRRNEVAPELSPKPTPLTEEEQAINVVVQRYLQNELINNPFIPDVIERRIYVNVMKLIIGVLKDTVEHANIDILGHRIHFSMSPQFDCSNKDVLSENKSHTDTTCNRDDMAENGIIIGFKDDSDTTL